jgi:hypothetical protein
MVSQPESPTSFSPWRRWGIGLNVLVVIVAVLAVVVMVNYLSRDYFLRLQCSARTKIELAPRTLSLLHSITNRVRVILYYDKKEPLYTTVVDLLNQYARVNPKISVQTVDYLRDPAAAQKFKTDYKLVSTTEKNLVIFDCEGRVLQIDGNALTRYIHERVPGAKELEFRKKPTEFEGETRFSAALLAVTSPKPLQAYILQGHLEHSMESPGDFGYLKFVSILQQNDVLVQPLSLLGTNTVPPDCNLLVIAGASKPLAEPELEKLDHYLTHGGRMLILFNAASISKETGLEVTGLEKVLAKWGVEVGAQVIEDPANFVRSRQDMVVTIFNPKHALVNPLLGSGLYMTMPRAIRKMKGASPAADATHVDELAFTSPRAVAGNSRSPEQFPLMVAVEQGPIQGVLTERGATRIVVAGDSFFLANAWIESAGNRDFAGYAINWLLNRAQLLQGIGPKPVGEYKIVMSNSQLQRAQWILLAAFPGGVLILGGLVRLRRRK